ncbi:hypothetical protein NA57DRAFT_52077 [Rhizodiscina lignyota]|uniref:Xylanolytic transcriptional activator regulatory domain-containing protein n=1 Tax=Rhizodiscina lignyota TaxID=1504668 RepID=A0A9P4M985_9PEZI|nr:hypothetical protein NA57DRAFT_52077 [Rhizodiscina lignyota]
MPTSQGAFPCLSLNLSSFHLTPSRLLHNLNVAKFYCDNIRCTGAPPSCDRCKRLRRDCSYGTFSPQLRRDWTSPPSRAPVTNIATPVSNGDAAASSNDNISASAPHPSETSARAERGNDLQGAYCGVPQALIWDLIEIYFSHIYNSSLLLHKSSFLQDVRSGTVTSHVLLSVCAFASKYGIATFYRDAAGNHVLTDAGFGHEWATRAADLVSQKLGEPEEENIVTFINVALYWYSEGKWRKCYIYKWNGVEIAYVLGIPSRRRETAETLGTELSRRRFWACFCIMSFGAKPLFLANNSLDLLENVPLPCSDQGYENGTSTNETERTAALGDDSVYADLIRALALWNDVSQAVKTADTRLSVLQDLHSRISDWWSGLSPSLKVSSDSLPSAPRQTSPLLLLICIIYHQSLCALHASIVPLFSYNLNTENLSYARQVSAQLAYEHSDAISTLLKAVLRHSFEMDRIPSFVGYAAYCACAVQMPFFWCTNQGVQDRVRSNVLANLRIIQQIGKYWRYVALLGINAQALYAMHARNPQLLDNEPKFMDVSKLDPPRRGMDRATKSILSHNDIVWRSGGSMAQRDAEITDLGLEQSRSASVAPGEGAIDSLINEISGKNAADVSGNQNFLPGSMPSAMPYGDMSRMYFMPNFLNEGFEYLPQGHDVSSEQLASFDTWLGQFGFEIESRNEDFSA